MRAVGLDVGSMSLKVAVLDDGKVVASRIMPCGDNIEAVAKAEIETAAGQTINNMPAVVTGAGGKLISFISQRKAITTCLSYGIRRLFPSARMVIDMGAESTTVIKLNERGRLIDWANHDKCASGTGLFLQQMGKLMKMPLDDMAKISQQASIPAEISSTCAVFAESEVISHIHRNPPTPKEDIVAGIFESVVSRIVSLCKRVGAEGDIAVTGGVALNDGVVNALERGLGQKLMRPEVPQIVAALGAAAIAMENAEKGLKQ